MIQRGLLKHLTPTTSHPTSISISTQMKPDSASLPALVFSLAPNSFVYSNTRLQLARRWKSILQHLGRFAFRRRGLGSSLPPWARERKSCSWRPTLRRPTDLHGKINPSLVYNWLHLYLFLFYFERTKTEKRKKKANTSLPGFPGFLASEKKGEPSWSPICLQVSPDVDSGTRFQSLPTKPPHPNPPPPFFFSPSPWTCWLRMSLESWERPRNGEQREVDKEGGGEEEGKKQPEAWRSMLCACAPAGEASG